MSQNPLRLLAKLRRFPEGGDSSEYLRTEHRQNLKAIEDALRRLGGTLNSQGQPIGSSSSDGSLWTDTGALNITSTVSPQKGVVVYDSLKWIRRGQNALIRFDYYQTGAGGTGNSGTGNYNINIPSSIGTIKTSVTNTYTGTTPQEAESTALVGTANYWNGGTFYSASVFVKSSSQVQVASAANNSIWGDVSASFAGLCRISGWFEVPIVEFES